MKGRTAGRLMLFALGLLSFSVLGSAHVWAQTASPSPTATPATKDCSDFQTQQEAQAFYDAHKNDKAGDPDPYDLDADGDGTACEGLPSAASATPTPTPASGSLPQNGAETTVLALSGFTFLEAGYGMTLLARKMGLKRRQIPAKVLRMMIAAHREGKSEIAIADDLYLVRVADDAEPVVEESIEDYAQSVTATPVTGGRVYASLAQGKEVDRPGLREPVVEKTPDDWPYFTPPVS